MGEVLMREGIYCLELPHLIALNYYSNKHVKNVSLLPSKCVPIVHQGYCMNLLNPFKNLHNQCNIYFCNLVLELNRPQLKQDIIFTFKGFVWQ